MGDNDDIRIAGIKDASVDLRAAYVAVLPDGSRIGLPVGTRLLPDNEQAVFSAGPVPEPGLAYA